MTHYIRANVDLFIKPSLSPEHIKYLQKFAEIRHMRRDASLLKNMPDEIRTAANLPVGKDGQYYLGDVHHGGDKSISDQNEPPADQPSLYCYWAPRNSGERLDLVKESGETYEAVKWLQYLISHFFELWGYKLTGSAVIQGEAVEDRCEVQVIQGNNTMRVYNEWENSVRYYDPMGEPKKDRTTQIVVLADGETWTGLDGCRIVTMSVEDLDMLVEDPKLLDHPEDYGWHVQDISEIVGKCK